MFRKKLVEKNIGKSIGFVWRGTEISRLEGLSDAVFAFAITLLVVSLEVPKTYSELIKMMQGFVAFGLCFFLLISIWYNHYLFFRRYGLNDIFTIVLNSILLFVVLFYIYPLKFLFTLLVNQILFPQANNAIGIINHSQVSNLMIIFSIGYLAIFLIFVLLYIHAFRKGEKLNLNEIEKHYTKNEIFSFLIHIFIAFSSICIALLVNPENSGLSGWIYMLLGPALTIHGFYGSRKAKKIMTD